MKERPILFKGEMVRAILENRKTQTRRLVKPQPLGGQRIVEGVAGITIGMNPAYDGGVWYATDCIHPGTKVKCKFGQVGDRLWVKETFLYRAQKTAALYKADLEGTEAAGVGAMYGGWKPSIFMKRPFSRITLEITGIRVERLQDITEEDAKAEGTDPIAFEPPFDEPIKASKYRAGYINIWESINGPDSWDANPWVWVINFKRIDNAR